MKPAQRLRLRRKAKLRGRAQFTGSFSSRRQGKFFTLASRSSSAGEQARLGMIVGKQAARRSVSRTLIKRTIREVFRQMRHELGAIDVVVRLKRQATRAELPAARQELESLLRNTR